MNGSEDRFAGKGVVVTGAAQGIGRAPRAGRNGHAAPRRYPLSEERELT
jgi:hypothetical protein